MFLINWLIDFIRNIPNITNAPITFKITSSISQQPDIVINCNSSIPITMQIIVTKKFLNFFCFFYNIGKKKAKGIKATAFPKILYINIYGAISPLINFVM